MKSVILLIGLFSLAWPASGCQIPVFRYALENWPPEPYRLAVFHSGSLTAGQTAALQRLAPGEDANLLKVEKIAIPPEPAAPWTKAWNAVSGQTLPRLVLLYPAALGTDEPVWSGPVDDASVQALLASPARAEITRRLLAGHSAVWLFLPKGDPQLDQPARQRLEQRLRELAGTLQLPPDDADSATASPPTQPLSNIPLHIEFSILDLNPADPAEAVLVNGLGLMRREVPDGPVVIPVIGRCRALCILNRADLDGKLLEETARFLTGACSCQAKADNPGLDLFVPVRWNEILPSRLPLEALNVELTVPQAPLPPTAASAGTASPPAGEHKSGSGRIWRTLALALAGLGLVVAAASLTLLRHQRTGSQSKP